MSKKESYKNLLISLLPPGAAWQPAAGSNLSKILSIIAAPFSRIDVRSSDLVKEADPRTAAEMLSDWEAVAGLPDSCSALEDTIQERRQALVQRVTGRGGQSAAYFIELAETMGYEIEITEHRPFVCGQSECGLGAVEGVNTTLLYQLTDDLNIRHYWKVLVTGPRVTWFQCGASECGKDPLTKISRAEDLECVLNKLKPAHTYLTLAYEGV